MKVVLVQLAPSFGEQGTSVSRARIRFGVIHSEFSMLDQGVWAEVKIAGEHLRLFSEHNAQGVQVSVYNVNAKNWIAPSEPVEDIEQGKDRAAAYARDYLMRTVNAALPPLEWKKSRSA
jgi:hypothetical protein